MEAHETQGKVLEQALESLDYDSRPVAARPEDKASKRPMSEKTAGPIQKYALMMLLDTLDPEKLAEYIARVKPTVYAIEYIYQKPLKECSLKEIVDGLVMTARALNWYDKVDCSDDGDHFTLKISHSMGPNASLVIRMVDETVLKTYGASAESVVADNCVSHIIHKVK